MARKRNNRPWLAGLLGLLLLAGCSGGPATPSQLDDAMLAGLDRPGVFVGDLAGDGRHLARRIGVSRALDLVGLKNDLAAIAKGLKAHLDRPVEEQAAGEAMVFRTDLGVLKIHFESRPAVAVVLDDWGLKKDPGRDLGGLAGPLNIAVIPSLPYSRKSAQAATALGFEVLVHLPMQSHAGEHQEENTIRVDMEPVRVREFFMQAVESVPGARGVNNHQGSLATEDTDVMRILMEEFKDRGLYFLDSRTSSKSLGKPFADEFGVPFARRHVFLDNVAEEAAVKAQWDKVLARAKKRGSCIAIGHPHAATLQVLKDQLGDLAAQGIDLVKVSDLVKVTP